MAVDIRKILILTVVVWFVACGGQPPTPSPSAPAFTVGTEGSVHRFHDDEYNVTCWVYTGYKQGGISCIPDTQLKEEPSHGRWY